MDGRRTTDVRAGDIAGSIARTSLARKTIAAVLVSAAGFASVGRAQTVEWARSAGGNGYDYGWGIAVDDSGNSYASGIYSGEATFGPITLTSVGGEDVFVVKYDASGQVIWARSGGGVLDDFGYGIAVDVTGNCYVTGIIGGTASFGAMTLTSSTGRTLFVTKFDTDGNVLWAVSSGEDSDAVGVGIAAEPAGNCYVTGAYSGTATFGTFKLTSAVPGDIFVVKYNTDGIPVWVRSSRGTVGSDVGIAIAVDPFGNSYVTGAISGTVTFGPFVLAGPASGTLGIFVVKYDANGNELWARSPESWGFDFGNDIAADGTGDCYVTGRYHGPATFGPFVLPSLGYSNASDVFVVKYDKDGAVLWVESAGGIANDHGDGIAVDAEGNSYVTGSYGGEATFGPFTLTNTGGHHTFVAKYDAGGSVVWIESSDRALSLSSVSVRGQGIDLDTMGNAHVIGSYAGSVSLGPFKLTSAGSADIFVAKFNSECPPTGCVCDNSCGDINGDASGVNQPSSITDLLDYALFANCFGLSPNYSRDCFCSDLNGDGAIDRTDFAILVDYFESVSQSTPPNCP